MIRFFIAAMLSLVFLSTSADAKTDNPYDIESHNATVKVAVLGDGLYSGFGLFQPEESYVNRLESHLLSQRFSKKISILDHTNEGLRTSTAFQYLPGMLHKKPDIVIVGLGYNDALAGADIDTMHNNMDSILTELYRKRIYVMLFQPTLPQDIEHHYVSRFNNMFSKLVKRYNNVVFVSDFMSGVVTSPYAFDAATRYPSELGATMMLDGTQEQIVMAIKKVRRLRIDLRRGR